MKHIDSSQIAIVGVIGSCKTIGVEIAEAINANKSIVIIADEKQRNPFENIPSVPIYNFKEPQMYVEPMTRKERRKRERKQRKSK